MSRWKPGKNKIQPKKAPKKYRSRPKPGVKPVAIFAEKDGHLVKYFNNLEQAQRYKYLNGGILHEFRNMKELYDYINGRTELIIR